MQWILALFLSGATGVAIAAEPVVLQDSEFFDSDWESVVYVNGGSSQSSERRPLGGNPDAYRHMTHDLPPSSNISVRHMSRTMLYDPSTDGAVGGITVRFDQIELAPPFFGAAVGSLFEVEQGGNIYYATTDLTYTNTAWKTARLFCLHAADFSPPGLNLSASGGPIRFGFLRSNTNNSTTAGISITHGIDNYRVAIHPADNPECAGEPADIRISKTDNRHPWSLDPVVRYTLTVSNVGGSAAPVILQEIVPWNSRFRPALSTPGWNCPSGDGGSSCTLAIPSLVPEATVDIDFTVKAVNATPAFWGFFNEASAAGGGTGVVAVDVTSPGPCVPDNLLAADLCGIVCRMYPTVCNAATQPPLPGSLAAAPPAIADASAGTEANVFDLFLLYRIRDRVLEQTRGGQRADQLFYEHRVDAARASFTDPSILDLARTAVAAIEADLRAVLAGHGDEAVLDASELAAIDAFVEALRTAAPPSLAEALDRELARLDPDGWTGVTFTDAFSRLSRLTCEGHEQLLLCGDVTGDCTITASDALKALRIAVGQLPAQAEADMDSSGVVTAGDALGILRQAVGTLPPTDACN